MKNSTLIKMTVVVCIAIFALFAACPCMAEIYPKTAIIREVDYEEDIVLCEDCNGNIWAFGEVEDWDIDDIVSMIMDDNNTPETIYDDIIVMVRYGGYAEGLL